MKIGKMKIVALIIAAPFTVLFCALWLEDLNQGLQVRKWEIENHGMKAFTQSAPLHNLVENLLGESTPISFRKNQAQLLIDWMMPKKLASS